MEEIVKGVEIVLEIIRIEEQILVIQTNKPLILPYCTEAQTINKPR